MGQFDLVNSNRQNYGSVYIKADKSFESKMSRAISRSVKIATEKIAKDIANVARDSAREILLRDATPKDENSMILLYKVANSIKVNKIDDNKYIITVPDDEEHLPRYLEYGSGLRGATSKSTRYKRYANSSGWQYMLNSDSYYKGGFVFKNKYNHYLDENDISPAIFDDGNIIEQETLSKTYEIGASETIRHYKSGKTAVVKTSSYLQTRTKSGRGKDGTPRVYSQGIVGIFYMYRGRRIVQSIIRKSKTTNELKENLKKFRNILGGEK